MIQINMKHSTYTNMLEYCDTELLETVFADIRYNNGNVFVDDENIVEDEWYIDDYLQSKTLDISEKLKVIFVFNEFGILYFEGNNIAYEVLCGKLNSKVADDIIKLWIHSKCNDIVPHYELGKLEIPLILPKYAFTDLPKGYVLEVLKKGAYHTTEEFYSTKEEVLQRINELEEMEYEQPN